MKRKLLIVVGLALVAAVPALALSYPLSSVTAEVISVTTTAERVTEDIGVTTGWKTCTLWNNSATILYVGGTTVDSTDGFPICTNTSNCPAASITIDSAAYYVVAAAGTLTPNLICGR